MKEFAARDKNDPLFMTPRDFLHESLRIMVELTAEPAYIDRDIVEKSTQVIYMLTELEDSLFYLVLESEKGSFRTNYFTSLENLNRYARINSVEWTLLWVRHNL